MITLLLPAVATAQPGSRITVNADIHHQTMTGWEATAQAGQEEYPEIFPLYRDELFDRTVNELGINRMRLEAHANVETSEDFLPIWLSGKIGYYEWRKQYYRVENDNEDPYDINWAGFHFSRVDFWIDTVVLPIKKLVEANGEKLFINLCFVDFTPTPFEHKNFHPEYGEFVLATYLHLQDKYGWVPDAWEVKLEADWIDKWTPDQMVKVMLAASNRLVENGFTPRFIAPSAQNARNASRYLDHMIKFPFIRKYLYELSYHLYDDANDFTRNEIGKRSRQYGINTSQLEYIGADHYDLYKDITLANNSAWAQFTIAWPTSGGTDDGGKYYIIDDRDPSKPTLRMGGRTPYLRQFFKYVRAGAVRVDAATESEGVYPTAFVNQNGANVVVIIADAARSFDIDGLPAGKYGVFYSADRAGTRSETDRQYSGSGPLQVNLPERGVITVHQLMDATE